MEEIRWNEQVNFIPLFDQFPTWLIKGFAADFEKVAANGYSMSSEQAERAFKTCSRQAQMYLHQEGKSKSGVIDWNKTANEYLDEFKKWKEKQQNDN